MIKENLPLELLTKHLPTLGLREPLIIEDVNYLLQKIETKAESAVVFLPKSKLLIDMTLSLVSSIVTEGGLIVLAGEKKAGIESAKKLYETNIGPVDQKIVGNHSALYVGLNRKLGAGKKQNDFLSYVTQTYKEHSLEIANFPGVFSSGELDAGTQLLLETIPYTAKRVLDVGCGAGTIAAFYKTVRPDSIVTACDISLAAVHASKATAQKNNLDLQIVTSDVFSNITGTFDLILANPPFHTGIETDYSFMGRFAEHARKFLAPHGEIYIVANSFLSYTKLLEEHVGKTELVIDNGKFKILKTVVAI